MTSPQATLLFALALVCAPADSRTDDALSAVAARVAETAGAAGGKRVAAADVAADTIRTKAGAAFDAAVPAERAASLRAVLAALHLSKPDADLRARVVDFAAAAFDRAGDPTDLAGQIQATRLLALEREAARLDAPAFIAAGADLDARLARLAVVAGLGIDLADRTLRDHAEEIAAATSSREVPDSATWDPFGALARVGATPWEVGVWSFATIDGAAFVRGVRDVDPSALARLVTDPPRTTAAIFSPKAWLGGAPAAPAFEAADLAPELGAGWARVADETLGAMQFELWLTIEGEPARAARAVEGLAADRCRVYASGERRLLHWTGEFAREEDAIHAEEAIAKAFARRTHRETGQRPDESGGLVKRRAGVDGVVIDAVERSGARVVWLSGESAGRAELMARSLRR